jgi:hypothetical protein
MADDVEPSDLVLHQPFLEAIKASVDEHGEEVVYWAWQTFFVAFLPFAGTLLAEQRAAEQAKKYELTLDQALDAIALVGNLRGASDPHKAWLAAEILFRTCDPVAIENLLAAAAVPHKHDA